MLANMEHEVNEYIKYLLDTYPVRERYVNILTQMQDVLEGMGILDKVSINTAILGKAILDYFEDIDKLKKYEGIENINVDKIYGYETFWLLRRSPIQFVIDAEELDKKYLHINEKVFASIMVAKMLKEKGIKANDNGEALIPFMELLYYNFKYRIFTQKSLEMTVSAFFCGCNIDKGVVLNKKGA